MDILFRHLRLLAHPGRPGVVCCACKFILQKAAYQTSIKACAVWRRLDHGSQCAARQRLPPLAALCTIRPLKSVFVALEEPQIQVTICESLLLRLRPCVCVCVGCTADGGHLVLLFRKTILCKKKSVGSQEALIGFAGS